METTTTNTNTQSYALSPGQPNNVNPDNLLLNSVQRAGIAVGPPGPPVFKYSPEEQIINAWMQEVFRDAAGLMTPISLNDREKCFKALSQVTGREDTEFTRDAVDKFLQKICEKIASHRRPGIGGTDGYNPAKDFDQNGDGVLDAKDLEKIWKEALLAW